MSPEKRRRSGKPTASPGKVGRKRSAAARSSRARDFTQAHLALAVHSANVGLWDWDLRTNKVRFSQEWKNQLGFEIDEISDDFAEWESRLHPDDAERAKAAVAAYLRTPISRYEIEFRMRHKDGRYRWILAQGSLVTDAAGAPTRLLGSHIDITQQKLADARLRSFEERFITAFNASPAGLTITRVSDGTFIDVNEAFLKMFEFARENVLGHSAAEIGVLEPAVLSKLIDAHTQTEDLNNAEVRARTKSGRSRHILISSRPVEVDGESCVLTTMIDITGRRRADTRIRLQATALNAAANSIVITNREGKIQWVNQAFTDLTGYSPDEVIGLSPRILKSGVQDAAFYKELWDTVLAGKVWRSELVNRRKDGSLYSEEEIITPLVNDHGSVTHFIAIKQDITDRKLAESRIRQQLERLRSLRTIDQSITSTFDLRSTLDVVLTQATTQLGVDAAAILLFDVHSAALQFAAGRGFHSRALEHTRLHLGEGHAGRAALEERTIHIPNMGAAGDDLARALHLQHENFVAYFGVPLMAKGHVKGVLEIFHRSALEPDEEWLAFLETLGGQAAIAIDNAQLLADMRRSNMELVSSYDATIVGWSRAMDLRDRETEGHTQRVTELTLLMARAAGMDDEEIAHVWRGALLHDMGKLGVPDEILFKPGTLSDEEWRVMKQHPQHAYEMLSPIKYLQRALEIPYCHHERWDGTGYPRGLKGEKIPLSARLFAVVDVWDALRSDRPYRAGWSDERVHDYIRANAGSHFDPRAVELLFHVLRERGRELTWAP